MYAVFAPFLPIYFATENYLRICGKEKLSMANSFSEFFTSISSSVMAFVLNIFLLRYGGTIAVVAMSVVMYVDSIVGMLMFGICDSLQPAISYCYGSGNRKKVKALFYRGMLDSIALSVLSLLFLRFAGQYATLFFVKPEDTELLAMSIRDMKIFAYSYLFGWIDTCFSSLFTALDRPVRSLVTASCGTIK